MDARGRNLSAMPEQITVIDRKKDLELQKILESYQVKIDKWKRNFTKNKRKKPDLNWQNSLISNTKKFINKLNNKGLNFEQQCDELDKLEEKEVLLGEIFRKGIAVCRHKAFLMKILLETQDVNIGIQTGRIINNENAITDSFIPHAWNYIDKEEKEGKKAKVIDPSNLLVLDEKYLDENFDYLYIDNKHPENYREHIKSIQPGERLLIGLDEENNLSDENHIRTNLSGKGFNPYMELEWTDDNKFILHRKDKTSKIEIINDGELENEIELDERLKTYIKINEKYPIIIIYPKDIRINYMRQLSKSFIKAQKKEGNSNKTEFELEELKEANQDLHLKALEIFGSDKFQESWQKKITE